MEKRDWGKLLATPREQGCVADCRGAYDEGGAACPWYGDCWVEEED